MHAEASPSRRWERWATAAAYLLGCACVFVGGYQLTLRHAVRLAPQASSWLPLDAAVPFWAWSVLPYTSLNVVAALSFFACRTEAALRRYALRLLAVQAVAFACFWLWPLRLQHARPDVEGFWRPLFEALASFDAPYNLLPSLHIAVLLCVWAALREALARRWWSVLHIWACMVALSAVTTWQHHVLDVAAGALLGAVAVGLLRAPSASAR